MELWGCCCSVEGAQGIVTKTGSKQSTESHRLSEFVLNNCRFPQQNMKDSLSTSRFFGLVIESGLSHLPWKSYFFFSAVRQHPAMFSSLFGKSENDIAQHKLYTSWALQRGKKHVPPTRIACLWFLLGPRRSWNFLQVSLGRGGGYAVVLAKNYLWKCEVPASGHRGGTGRAAFFLGFLKGNYQDNSIPSGWSDQSWSCWLSCFFPYSLWENFENLKLETDLKIFNAWRSASRYNHAGLQW